MSSQKKMKSLIINIFFDYLVDGVKENQLYLINLKCKNIRKMVVYFFSIVKEDSSDVPFYHHRATKKNYIHWMNNYYKI